jgi:hypothetical protein
MVEFHFGALCKSLKEQLKEQGYELPHEDYARFQMIADSITTLKLHGILPDSIVYKAHQKLLKQIVESIKKNASHPEKSPAKNT